MGRPTYEPSEDEAIAYLTTQTMQKLKNSLAKYSNIDNYKFEFSVCEGCKEQAISKNPYYKDDGKWFVLRSV